MLKGLALTPPIIGRISIGKVVEKNGKRLPEKDDEFTITSQVKAKDGWVPHPVDETLRAPGTKLRSIPVQMLFNDPALNFRANYSLFDRGSGRPICVGNGETCRRSTAAGMESLPCPSPSGCKLAIEGGCKPYGRLNVRIGDEDAFGSFIFRTTGFNSIRTLAARLQYFHSASGGMLATLPLELRLRGKSTTMSHRAPVYYVDLTERTGMSILDAFQQGRAEKERRDSLGFDQTALDRAAEAGLAAGEFEDSEEETGWIIEEFAFAPDVAVEGDDDVPTDAHVKPTLRAKLAAKASNLNVGVQ